MISNNNVTIKKYFYGFSSGFSIQDWNKVDDSFRHLGTPAPQADPAIRT